LAIQLVSFFLVFEDRQSYHVILSNEARSCLWQRLMSPEPLVPPSAEILAKLETDPKTGLNPAQLQERLSTYGPRVHPIQLIDECRA
jgi:Cation transporter/ATPase, N-terminus